MHKSHGVLQSFLKGEFNVPIGTKTKVLGAEEDFQKIAEKLAHADLLSCDFEDSIENASEGDLLFVDPPYTIKHNHNGFIKYNEHMFSWADQIRLRDALVRANRRGALILATNAAHECIRELYDKHFRLLPMTRASVISGKSCGRGQYEELLISNYL